MAIRWNRVATSCVLAGLVGSFTLIGDSHGAGWSIDRVKARFVVLDPKTGKTRSSHDLSPGRSLGPAVMNAGVLVAERQRCLSDDHVYEPGDSRVVGVDPDSGRLRWSRRDLALVESIAPFSLVTAPDRGAVLARDPGRAQNSAIHALDARSGRELWSLPTGSEVRAADDELVLVLDRTLAQVPGRVPTLLRAIDRTNGHERWRYDVGAVFDVLAAVGNGYVVATRVGGDGATGIVLDGATGDVVRTFTPTESFYVPLIADGALAVPRPFGGPSDVVDARSGELLWSLPATGGVESVGDAFLAMAPQPLLVSFLDGRTGHARWRHPVGLSYSGFLTAPNVLIVFAGAGLSRIALGSGDTMWSRSPPLPPVERDDVSITFSKNAVDARHVVFTRGCITTTAD